MARCLQMTATPGRGMRRFLLVVIVVQGILLAVRVRYYGNSQSAAVFHDHPSNQDLPKTLVPSVQSNITERITTFVHLGKTGGAAFQQNTRLDCNEDDDCVQKRFTPDNALSLSVRYVFDADHFAKAQLEESTSFVLSLRNPVDRFISAYTYSHPANCYNATTSWTDGCAIKNDFRNDGDFRYNSKPFKFFQKCCPTLHHLAAWDNDLSLECQEVALGTVQGRAGYYTSPHMWYNYEYFVTHSVDKYPEKEMFVLRTEHMWHDMVELDKMMGGKGEFTYRRESSNYTDLDEPSEKESLSDEEYQKLCCLLNKEISIYESIIHKAMNFNETAKKEMIGSVYDKCGIYTSQSDSWRLSCNQRLLSFPVKGVSATNLNRTITLVHLGKTAGTAFRENTRLDCTHPKVHWEGYEHDSQQCIKKYFTKDNVLAISVKHVFHTSYLTIKELDESTSFVVSVRNPVDRFISAYGYSHPANCNLGRSGTYGCTLKERFEKDGIGVYNGKPYKFFNKCCPTLKDVPRFSLNSSDSHCQKFVLDTVQGRSSFRVSPHMRYNHEYYKSHSINKYPEKEVFVIRTEYMWNDIVELDKQLGGSGEFTYKGWKHTHGSEHFKKESLSTKDYQDLCCLLSKEISIFESIVHMAMNLNETTKTKTIDSVYEKCGVDATSRKDWRISCDLRVSAATNATRADSN